MTRGRRLAILIAAFAGTGWFAFFAEGPAHLPATMKAGAAVAVPRPPAIHSQRLLDRQQWQSTTPSDAVDLFQLRALAPVLAPAATPAPTPPPPPVIQAPAPPPLPYRYLGKQKREGEAWQVFLLRQDQVFVVREGELLESAYRVERIAPPTLSLRDLASQQTQTLNIGESN